MWAQEPLFFIFKITVGSDVFIFAVVRIEFHLRERWTCKSSCDRGFFVKVCITGRICIAGETPHNPARPECLHSVGYSVPLTNTLDKLPRLLEKAGTANAPVVVTVDDKAELLCTL
jgi:hypothetical protein